MSGPYLNLYDGTTMPLNAGLWSGSGNYSILGYPAPILQGLALWLRSDSGVVLNGSTVQQWNDLSGNGNNVTQATTGKQPTYNTAGGVNGLPRLTYSQSSGTLLSNTTANLVASNGPRTVITVAAIGTAGYLGGMLLTFRRGTPICGLFCVNLAGTNYAYTDGTATNDTFTAFPTTGVHTYVHEFNGTGNAFAFSIDGAAQTLTGGNPSHSDTGTTGFTIGNREDGPSNQGWDGDIYEVLVYNGILSASQLASVNAYIQARYYTAPPIPGYSLWLRGDLGVQTTTGVYQWSDASGNGNHFTQTTSGTTQPTVIGSGLNSLPGVSFRAASTQFLTCANQINFGPGTLFVVATCQSTSVGIQAVLNTNNSDMYMSLSGAQWGMFTNASLLGPSLTVGTSYVLQGTVRNFNDVDIVTNGALVNATTGTAYTAKSGTRIGKDVSASQYGNYDLYEMIYYPTALPASQSLLVRQYLYARYGLTGT